MESSLRGHDHAECRQVFRIEHVYRAEPVALSAQVRTGGAAQPATAAFVATEEYLERRFRHGRLWNTGEDSFRIARTGHSALVEAL